VKNRLRVGYERNRQSGASTSPDLIVAIPGIGGSALERNGKLLWDTSKWSVLRNLFDVEYVRALSLPPSGEEAAVVATRLVSGITVLPGLPSYGSYGPLTSALRDAYGRQNVAEFPYDWRRSNRVTAAKLDEFVKVELEKRTEGTAIVLIGHSMGGLVARHWLMTSQLAFRCRLLVSLGTPFRGATKALTAIANGIGPSSHLSDALAKTFRTMPSVFELLPTYACLDSNGVGSGRRHLDPGTSPIQLTALEAANYEAALGGAICSVSDVLAEHVAIVSDHQPTPTIGVFRAGVFVPREYGAVSVGDGTVPRGSMQPHEWRDVSAGAIPVTARHVNLPTSKHVIRAVLSTIDGRERLTLSPDAPATFQIDLPQVVRCEDALDLVAETSTDQVRVTAIATELRSGEQAVRELRRSDLDNGGYGFRARFTDLAEGVYVVRVAGDIDGQHQTLDEVVFVYNA